MARIAEDIDIRLEAGVWRARRAAHEARSQALFGDAVERRSAGKDPVMDFLFEYYSFRPARLMRWTPGIGVLLEGAALADFDGLKGAEAIEGGVALPGRSFPARRRSGTTWIREMMDKTRGRAPFLGCFGLHEWAMVYKADEVRHDQVPMRMSPEELAAFVESRQVVCTHHDAFRFFTPEARPLNRHQPSFETMAALEQPGCLHTNMDLYKWAYKLYPWVASELIVDALEVAMEARRLDMRASPYDMTAAGLDPVAIETPEGRREYQRLQSQIREKAEPIRARLIEAYDRVLTRAPVDP